MSLSKKWLLLVMVWLPLCIYQPHQISAQLTSSQSKPASAIPAHPKSPKPPPEVAPIQFAKPGWSENQIEIGQSRRWYRVFRPHNFQMGNPAVVLIHGGGQSMRKIFQGDNNPAKHWKVIAEREGFLLIVPNGTNARTGDTKGDRQNWNDLRTDGVANPDADDVQFISKLLDSIQPSCKFDSRRVYVTGASNGGMMTFRLLIEEPKRFAAGAAFIASLPAADQTISPPETPTPILICNGTKDPLVKWEGGVIGRNRGVVRSVEATVQWWATANKCDPHPKSMKRLPDRAPDDGCRIQHYVYQPARGGAALEFFKVVGGGHSLPSIHSRLPENRLIKSLIGNMCHDVEGAELAWEFLQRHQR